MIQHCPFENGDINSSILISFLMQTISAHAKKAIQTHILSDSKSSVISISREHD